MTESHVLLVKTNKSVTNKHRSIYHGFQLQILVNDPNDALFMRITWNQWTDRVDDVLIDKIFEYKKNVCHWYERYTNVKRDMLLRSTWKWQLLTTFHTWLIRNDIITIPTKYRQFRFGASWHLASGNKIVEETMRLDDERVTSRFFFMRVLLRGCENASNMM